MGLILLIVLILLLIGAFPSWPYSRNWGYWPSGGLGLVVVIILILLSWDEFKSLRDLLSRSRASTSADEAWRLRPLCRACASDRPSFETSCRPRSTRR